LFENSLKKKSKEEMAVAKAASGVLLSRPVTFVTGNAKKLEEVRAILGQSIPFQSLKLDCDISLSLCVFVSMGNKNYMIMGLMLFLLSVLTVPELQGEPEEISKEKARLAAVEVQYMPPNIFVCIGFFFCVCK
jgi:inosine triphosphate pyrophosphatase